MYAPGVDSHPPIRVSNHNPSNRQTFHHSDSLFNPRARALGFRTLSTLPDGCLQPLVQQKHHILLGVLPAGDAQGADKKWAGGRIDDQSPEFKV